MAPRKLEFEIPRRSFNQPILQRLRNVLAIDARTSRKIGNRSSHLQHAIVSSRREAKLLGGAEEQRASFRVETAMRRDGTTAQVRICPRSVGSVPRMLELPRVEDASANGRRGLTKCGVGDGADRNSGNLDDQVDAIAERTR